MKMTLQMQILPSLEQRALLLATMSACNHAATHAARVGFYDRVFSQPGIQARCYRYLRSQFGLSSQMAVRAVGKAAECFARDKRRCPCFKPYGAVAYDNRILSFKGTDRVSILTVAGRQVIPVALGAYQKAQLRNLKGQCDLVFRDGRFYLLATIDTPESALIEVDSFIGVDLGVAQIATTSDGQAISGDAIERVRVQHFRARRSMLKKSSTSKRRSTRKNTRTALRRLGSKEARFRRHVNHVISKTLVLQAKDTSRGIALEDLKGIRERIRFRKKQRARMGGWAFRQLRSFIEYKSRLNGIPLAIVNPRNTSRTCSRCGYCDKDNRKTQDQFTCLHCGFSCNADHNAAINLAAKAAASPPQPPQKQPFGCPVEVGS